MGSRNKVASHAIGYFLQNFKILFSIAFCSTINGYKIFIIYPISPSCKFQNRTYSVQRLEKIIEDPLDDKCELSFLKIKIKFLNSLASIVPI
jgi:hypothetical protein